MVYHGCYKLVSVVTALDSIFSDQQCSLNSQDIQLGNSCKLIRMFRGLCLTVNLSKGVGMKCKVGD